MKRYLALYFAITLLLTTKTFAQGRERLKYYVGIGPTIDGNGGLLGVNVSNELSFGLANRLSVNPAFIYYQSIRYWDEGDKDDQDNSSGLFTNLTLKYDVLKTKRDFRISLAFGPSFQIGSENGYRGSVLRYDPFGDYYEDLYSVERYFRLGYTQQVAFDWRTKKETRSNSVLVSLSSFDGYWPWYLMATYRIGFRLK